MLEPGNVEIFKRPVLKNADDSVSTTVSIGINDHGQEVLIPAVVNGKKLFTIGADGRPDFREAIKHYLTTGEHLGKFDTPANSDAYANALHNAQTDQMKLPRGNEPIR